MRKQRQRLGWLHSCSRLLHVGRVQFLAVKQGKGVAARRGQQRLLMGRRLLELEIVGWSIKPASGERFWRGLRWGGAGFSLAWLLNQWLQ
jgi:hypothetical protein